MVSHLIDLLKLLEVVLSDVLFDLRGIVHEQTVV